MIDQQLARLRTHRNNIQRYRNLLQTSLTELERTALDRGAIKFGEPDKLPSMTFAGFRQRFVGWRTDDAFELR